jgi:hypothetical protein
MRLLPSLGRLVPIGRFGVLMPYDENDPALDLRGGGSDSNRMGALARELVGLQPDIS